MGYCIFIAGVVIELSLLQVFQLTALIVRGMMISGERFFISLDRVGIAEDELRDALLCVQEFVSGRHFNQTSFFCDSGIAILAKSRQFLTKLPPVLCMNLGATWRPRFVRKC